MTREPELSETNSFSSLSFQMTPKTVVINAKFSTELVFVCMCVHEHSIGDARRVTKANQDKLCSQQAQHCSWPWVGEWLLWLPQMLQVLCVGQKIPMWDQDLECRNLHSRCLASVQAAVLLLPRRDYASACTEKTSLLSRCENYFQANTKILSSTQTKSDTGSFAFYKAKLSWLNWKL